MRISHKGVCKYPWLSPVISFSGDVGMCCNDIHFKLKIGNIKKQPLEKIWKNKRAMHIRLMHITDQLERTPKGICSICRHYMDVPTLDDETIFKYLESIHREDLIDFYKAWNRDAYKLEFQYRRERDPKTISYLYPLYPNLVKNKHFRNVFSDHAYLGSDKSLLFYVEIPKDAFIMKISFHAAGIGESAEFETFLDGNLLGKRIARMIGNGTGEIIEYVIHDQEILNNIKDKEVVKLQFNVIKGSLALFDKSDLFENLHVFFWKKVPTPYVRHKKFYEYKLISSIVQGKHSYFSYNDVTYIQLEKGSELITAVKTSKDIKALKIMVHVCGIKQMQDLEISFNGFKFKRKAKLVENGIGNTLEFIIDKFKRLNKFIIKPLSGPISIPIEGDISIKNINLYPKKEIPFKKNNDDYIYNIYDGIILGEHFKYNNEDNFNKGYSFLAIKEEIYFPIRFGNKVKLQLAGIGGIAKFTINGLPAIAPEISGGKGKVMEFKLKSNKIVIKVKKGVLAVLQDPIEPNLPKTPLVIIQKL